MTLSDDCVLNLLKIVVITQGRALRNVCWRWRKLLDSCDLYNLMEQHMDLLCWEIAERQLKIQAYDDSIERKRLPLDTPFLTARVEGLTPFRSKDLAAVCKKIKFGGRYRMSFTLREITTLRELFVKWPHYKKWMFYVPFREESRNFLFTSRSNPGWLG